MNIRKSLLFGFLFILIAAPLCAQAGVFSFISSMFSTSVHAEEPMQNSQTMALLEAIHSPIVAVVATTSDITIENGTSLSQSENPNALSGSSDHTIANDQISIYVVRKGDTLPAIAKMFGVSVNTIRWGNDLKNNTISVGQTLVILPISGVEHIVKAGDTIKSIATLHKGNVDDIMQYNNLTPDSKLAVGDIVIVPDGEATTVATPSGNSSNTSKNIKKNGTSSVSVTIASQGYPVYDGYYMRPIVGGVKTQGIHGHNAVDLASSYGTNILASAEGDVIISKDSGWNGGYGSYIVLKHNNGTQTLYAHLSATLVNVGDHVTQGQVIGHMGSTGDSTGVHVHFEIRGAINPF